MLSHLPLHEFWPKEPLLPETVLLLETLFSSPITASHSKQWTDHDPYLSRVWNLVSKGCSESVSDDLQPYYRQKDEWSTKCGCVLFGNRVVISSVGRENIRELYILELWKWKTYSEEQDLMAELTEAWLLRYRNVFLTNISKCGTTASMGIAKLPFVEKSYRSCWTVARGNDVNSSRNTRKGLKHSLCCLNPLLRWLLSSGICLQHMDYQSHCVRQRNLLHQFGISTIPAETVWNTRDCHHITQLRLGWQRGQYRP